MTESVLTYVLPVVAAFVWAGSIVVTRRALLHGASALQATPASALVNVPLYWVTLGAAVALGAATPVFTPTVVAAFVASGLVGTTGARLVSNRGIDRLGASVNAAAVSTRPLFAAVLALFVLDEVVAPATAAGVVVLVAGVVLLSLSGGGKIGGWPKASLALPLAAAALFAVSDVLRRFGLTVAPVPALQGVAVHEVAGLVGLVVVAAAIRGRDVLAVPADARRSLLVGGALFGVAMLLFVEALRRGKVAVVTALAGTAPLFVTVLSHLFLPGVERLTRGMIVATLLIVLGGGVIVLF
ncbi:MAG: EamA family transporter [Haloferacaceae archaeon]